MSCLGLQILYFFLNRREDTYCERAFAPWPDMEKAMRENNIPLYSLETYTPLKEFDFVGFTLQYEMCYTNLLNMLDMSGIPIYAKDRGEDDPIIRFGGSCAYNPEPLAAVSYTHLENAPEGGERCLKCLELRLNEPAKCAADIGAEYVCTTLTISPLKNARCV